MSDPREAETLEEACANGDGTYNGYKALSWLSRALTGGEGIPEEEVRSIHEEVKSRLGK